MVSGQGIAHGSRKFTKTGYLKPSTKDSNLFSAQFNLVREQEGEAISLVELYSALEEAESSWFAMTGETANAIRSDAERYAAVAKVSDALSRCRKPDEFAKTLADTICEFLDVRQLDLVVFEEDATEIRRYEIGRGLNSVAVVPADELRQWHLQESEEPLAIADWSLDEHFPHVRQAVSSGAGIGSVLRLPLTTPFRRVGRLGLSSSAGVRYDREDLEFMRVIARVVAFAVDDAFHLARARAAQAEAQRRSERLQVLLDLTKRITSNLDLQEVLRTIVRNVRAALQNEFAGIALHDAASGTVRIYAVDFPDGEGVVQEGQVLTPSRAGKRVLETLEPAIVDLSDPEMDFPSEIARFMAARGVKSHCLIPLVNHGRALGVLVLGTRSEPPLAPEDIDFVQQISANIAIAIENALAFREISELKVKLAQEKLYLEQEIRSELNFEQIVGNGPGLRRVIGMVEKVAPSDSTVLLLGETGTGKELIARAIHESSRRRERTFVKLNCAAIPTGLLESELFGHEKGAFTGAMSRKIGRMELADQGTLFLDEVGDIPLEIQPKLLRALQEREFERLGTTQTRRVNVRLIAATNRDLEAMIAAREFRSDLYYRLKVFPIRIPPLRERREDIPLLVSFFVQKFAKQMQKNIDIIPAPLMKGLVNWAWPGNIRELENFIERAVILTRCRSLEAPLGELRTQGRENELHSRQQSGRHHIVPPTKETTGFLSDRKNGNHDRTLTQQQAIILALSETRGRVGGPDGAASRLGVNRTTLIYRMKRFGIDPRYYA